MRRHWAYLKYVLRHKWFVLVAGLRLGVPLWMLILHDWDKFLPDEWFPYARCFYKPDGTKQYDETQEFAHAWMLHQHRNKHHWQWWVTIGVLTDNFGVDIPDSDFMIWDRGDVSRVFKGDALSQPLYEVRTLHPDFIAIVPKPMPDIHRREMLADWRGAGRALGFPNTVEWYAKNREKLKLHLHPETRAWIEDQLHYDEFVEQDTRKEVTLA